jgi:hypothetical protein
MSNWMMAGCFSAGVLAALVTGCASREVEVTGEVSAAVGTDVQGPIVLELYDSKGTGEDLELERVHTASLQAPGKFSEKAEFSGDRVIVRAIDDRDRDGVCSAGEAWGEVEAEIHDDDSTDAIALVLSAKPCP